MQLQDVVLKQTEPVRVAEAVGTAPALGTENVSPVFRPLFQEVLAHLRTVGAKPGINIAHYDEPSDDGSVVLHVGFDIGDQDVPGADRVHVIELPVVDAASVVHRGRMEGIAPAFDALMRWTEQSRYRLAGPSRELYHEWHEDDPDSHLTELQLILDL
jgi:effector-binding domain-containing protein